MKKYLFYFLLIFNLSINSFGELVTAPDFKLKDQYGIEHSLEKYKNKKVFLIFWTSWCKYCEDTLEDIQQLYKENGENKKDIIFLTFNNEEKKDLKKILKEKKYEFPVINNKIIFYQYYVEYFPTNYIIDEKGKVVQSIAGQINKENLKKLIKNQNYKIEKKKVTN